LLNCFSLPAGIQPAPVFSWKIPGFEFLKISGAALAIAFAVFRSGFHLGKWIGYHSANIWTAGAVHFAFGMMLLDVLWMGLGLENLWYAPLLRVAFAMILGVLTAEFFFRGSFSGSAEFAFPSGPYGLLALMGLIFLAFSALQCFLPETHNDGLIYHLGVPLFWLLNHGMADFSSIPHAHFPYGGELFLFTGYLLQGTETAHLLNLFVWFAGSLAAAGWARESGGPNAGWLAFGLTLTLPLLSLAAWTSQVECFLTIYLVLFFHGLFQILLTKKIQGPVL
jgi:hypothetical protein